MELVGENISEKEVINEVTNSSLFLIQCWILPHADYWCDCKFPPETDTIKNQLS